MSAGVLGSGYDGCIGRGALAVCNGPSSSGVIANQSSGRECVELNASLKELGTAAWYTMSNVMHHIIIKLKDAIPSEQIESDGLGTLQLKQNPRVGM